MTEFARHKRVLRAEWAVVGAMLFYAVYISAYSAQKHWTFSTTGYDLSLYIQSLWNTLHGDFLRLTIAPGVRHFLSWYFTPSVVLLTPVYALWPSPVTLLIVQSVVVALGAWPVFQLAKESLGAPWLAAGYVCVYLMFPALLAANLYDLHGITLTGIYLDAGEHHVELVYDPPEWEGEWRVSAGTLVALVLASMASYLLRKASRPLPTQMLVEMVSKS